MNVNWKISKRLLLQLIMLCCSICASAYDFEVDGIYYDIFSSSQNTVRVTYKTQGDQGYSGELHIPEKVTYNNVEYTVTGINNQAFENCLGLTSFPTLPNSIITIGSQAFKGCSNITGLLSLPNSLKYIDGGAFQDCSGFTGQLILPNSLIWIGSGAFKNCSSFSGSLIIPASVKTLEIGAFMNCSGFSGSLIIPSSINKIEQVVFQNCTGISTVEIPNSIKSINLYAFSGCENITHVISKIETPFNIDEWVFKDISSDATLQVPNGTISNYQDCRGWLNHFKTIRDEGGTEFDIYTLAIKVKGNGSASYKDNKVDYWTERFYVLEGTTATISFHPYNGNRIKSVKVNDTDVTSSVSDNSYTISNITVNTTLDVEFEAIPSTTYTFSIKATGNGSVLYNGDTVRNQTSTFTVNEGTSATISFSPDNGYRIKSVKVNSTDVTSSVSNNSYTISNISANTSLEVEFEAIPVTTYTLSIKATGNGSVLYNGDTVRNQTSTFTVNEGISATISFSPDNGYRIKSVKVNNTDVTSSVSSNQYTINNISANTTLEVEFEGIPVTTYSLSITASGNGYVSYDGNSIRNETNSYTVNEGDNATITFSPDNGYRIGSVMVNNSDVTYWVSNNQYSISNISSNTTVEVTFEAIPVPTYSLSINASGNGYATYNGSAIRNRTTSFTVDEGSSATVIFAPDNGNSISSVKLNYSDITSQISGNSYTISNITANTSLSVTFQEDVNALTVDGLNYTVTSQSNKTVTLTSGGLGQVLTVPATITQNGTTWKVTGIDKDALKGNTELAAIIWNPEAVFTATVSNPNLLLYVKSSDYAPATIQNVVVNGTASNIILKEAKSGNNFYCPQSFVAQKISFTHSYQMQTGIGEARGWETIALPFDVQTITHATKGEIKPFANWKSGDTAKPFWLMELTGTGFVETGNIKAYTPYIISMPNNPQYDSQWLLNGKVTFAASSVTIGKTENLSQPTFQSRAFIPCFAEIKSDAGVHALNVNNDFETNNSGMTEGSRFVLNMRSVHPFEAYMKSSSSAPAYAIGVFEDMTTGMQMMIDGNWTKEEVVYDLQGRRVQTSNLKSLRNATLSKRETSNLKKGVYIVNGKKKIIK